MLGYKAFNKDLTCLGEFQYKIGETYTLVGELIMCRNGFHFCKTIQDTYNFYPDSENTRICKVEALGNIISNDDNSKYCTNKIKILEEVTEEWERKGNSNSTSTGYCNLGDRNTGNENSGSCNTGNCNFGHYNTGYENSGSYNTGDGNNGYSNTGNENSGSYNVGNANTGSYNTGDQNLGSNNSGCNNIGFHNSGSYNTGHYNAGDYNTGDYNTGSYNKGNRNTGDFNTGSYNVGDYNAGNYNIGCFNLTNGTNTIRMFDKETNMTISEWFLSKARAILFGMPKTVEWIDTYRMSEEEKKKYPDYIITGGYLKTLDEKYAQLYWDNLSEEEKNEILSLPNFDKDIFKKCTGIDVGDITL